MEQMVRYDAMIHAIAECHSVDEVKDLRDKALALEMYARQARNLDAERKASGVRIRAEIRAGELLKEMAENGERATKGKPAADSKSVTLKGLGISETQSVRWQALAEVPKEQIEAALADPLKRPSTSGLISLNKSPSPKLNEESLWLWGRLREFEERGYFDADPQYLLDEMTDAMQSDFRRIVPLMQAFFTTCERICND